MLRSLSTGEVIERRWTRFSFPLVWYYDVLRGLDYLRSAGVKPDERVAEAIAVVEEETAPERPMAAQSPAPRPDTNSHRAGDRGRLRQPLEHAARLACAGLGFRNPQRRLIYRPEQLPPPSTQNFEQCGWHSFTAPPANMPPCARAASASVAPISNASS